MRRRSGSGSTVRKSKQNLVILSLKSGSDIDLDVNLSTMRLKSVRKILYNQRGTMILAGSYRSKTESLQQNKISAEIRF
jgi:hypothetical protein